MLNPYLLLGGYGTLSQMRLRIETFPELFDESYDDIKLRRIDKQSIRKCRISL